MRKRNKKKSLLRFMGGEDGWPIPLVDVGFYRLQEEKPSDPVRKSKGLVRDPIEQSTLQEHQSPEPPD